MVVDKIKMFELRRGRESACEAGRTSEVHVIRFLRRSMLPPGPVTPSPSHCQAAQGYEC